MDKHTKTIIIFYVTMLLASIVTLSVLYLLPLVTSGTDPPVKLGVPIKNSRTENQTNNSPKSLSRLEYNKKRVSDVINIQDLLRIQK